MFDTPKYIDNTFNIFFQRQENIRRKANVFETALKDKYVTPLILPIPDDQEPEIPRIVFTSKNGFSQIIVSQVSIAITTQYSEDYQVDISKGRDYLLDRVPVIFLLASRINVIPVYSGFATRVNIPSKSSDAEILEHLSHHFNPLQDTQNLYDFQLKTTAVRKDKFFSNITVTNYRSWMAQQPPQRMTRLSTSEVVERGIQIIGDFNDRYTYNENEKYRSSRATARTIISDGLSEVENVITDLRKDQV